MNKSAGAVLDELLVLHAQGGDEEAFCALVNRWQRRLLRHAFYLTDRADAAADVVQETWLSVARGIKGLDDPACFPRWVLQIVTRKSADWVRSRRRERTLLGRLAEDRPTVGSSPGNSADDGLVLLREAVRRLPGDRRALISMIYLDNLSISEVAEVLDIPAGTVKSRLHHARQELRQLMERNKE